MKSGTLLARSLSAIKQYQTDFSCQHAPYQSDKPGQNVKGVFSSFMVVLNTSPIFLLIASNFEKHKKQLSESQEMLKLIKRSEKGKLVEGKLNQRKLKNNYSKKTYKQAAF